MSYELPRKNRASKIGIAMALTGLLFVAGGCGSLKMERVKVEVEAQSSGGIEVTPPRVYRNGDGFIVAGSLHRRGIGAHHPDPGHLHAYTLDAEGHVLRGTKTPAPYIRHNRHSSRESATYAFRLENLPPAGGRLRIVLHRFSMKECGE